MSILKTTPMFLMLLPLLSPLLAGADTLEWPFTKHDSYRSGYVTGAGEITEPVVFNRLSVGGTSDARASLSWDIDGDDRREILYVDSDRVIARDQEDRLYWATINLSLTEIHGVYDFNGDGSPEVLATGNDGLAIFDLRDGKLLWHKTGFQTNNNQTHDRNTRVGDINADGLPDIVVKAHLFSDGKVHAYGFKTGFNKDAPNGNELWAYTITDSFSGSIFPTLGDVDADGLLDVVVPAMNDVEILEGKTGVRKYLVGTSQLLQNAGSTLVVQLDSDPQLEVVRFINPNQAAGICVLDLVRFPTTMAAYEAYDKNTYRVFGGLDSVRDLDGNGVPEIVFNRWNGSRWQIVIMNYKETVNGSTSTAALTTLKTIDDAYLAGIRDLDNDGIQEIIYVPATSGATALPLLAGVKVAHFVNNDVTLMWEVQRAGTITSHAYELPSGVNSFLAGPPVVLLDVDGDGQGNLLINMDDNGDLRIDRLAALSPQGEEVLTYTLPTPGNFTVLEVTSSLTAAGAGQELLGLYDGQMRVYRNNLTLAASVTAAGVLVESQVADLDGDGFNDIYYQQVNAEANIVSGSEMLGPAVDPIPDWTYLLDSRQEALLIDTDGDGEKEVIVRDFRTRGKTLFYVFSASGEALGSFSEDVVLSDFIPGDLTGDGILDIVATYTAAPTYRAMLIDGYTFQIVWDSKTPASDNNQPSSPQRNVIIDVNGDSFKDFCLAMNDYFGCMDGKTGAAINKVQTSTFAGGPMITEADADASPDLILVNERSIGRYSLSATQEWKITRGTGETSDWAAGTFIMKGSVADVTGDGKSEIFAAAADNRLYRINSDGTTGWIRYLVAGAATSYAEDYRSSIQLTREVVADIDGDGQLEVIVGSSDGYLYCVDGATGTREWALPFLFKLGNPIVADADGDGLLEVLVSVGDSYLQMVDTAVLPAPGDVRDVGTGDDGAAQMGGPDIDQSETSDRLAATWNPVEGADGYLVAVFSSTGYYVVPWQNVGNVTSFVFVDNHFVYGSTYSVSVQAWNQDGAGAVGRSDGVQIVDLSKPLVQDFVAVPSIFNPDRTSSEISATLFDATELFSYSFKLAGQQGQVFTTGRSIGGTTYHFEYTFTGQDDENTNLDDGVYTATMSVFDVQGRQTSSTIDITIDTIAPPPPVFTTPQDGSVLAQSSVSFSGTGEAGRKLHLTVEGGSENDSCETSIQVDGVWSCPPLTLGDGSYTAVAVVEDDAGNISGPATLDFTLDTVGPEVPEILTPENGEWLARGEVEFSGVTFEEGPEVDILVDAVQYCVAGVEADLSFTCVGNFPLEDGAHSAVAIAKDFAGNTSAPSEAVSFHVDTVTPEPPTILHPQNDEVVSLARPVIDGTWDAAPENTNTCSLNGLNTPCISGENNTWSYTPTQDLADGRYVFHIQTSDLAGNTSEVVTVEFTVDVPDYDVDDDNYLECGQPGAGEVCDCDDADASVHPGADELPGDGVDNDCVDGDAATPTQEPSATPSPTPETPSPSPSPTPSPTPVMSPTPTITPTPETPTAPPTETPTATPTVTPETPTQAPLTDVPASPTPEGSPTSPGTGDVGCQCSTPDSGAPSAPVGFAAALLLVGLARRRR